MAFATAAGEPSYSGTYIPEVWSSKMLIKFYEGTVLSQVSNTDYEGEIKDHGDKVKIRQNVDIAIFDYEKGMNLPVQRPTSTNVELDIDKGKAFNFEVKDLDKKQSDLAFLNKWAEDASNQMKIEIERDVFADVYADAHASNKGATAGAISAAYNLGTTGSPLALTSTNVYDMLVDARTVLVEQNVPESDCFAILPAWACNLIKKSDLKAADFTGDATAMARTGIIGMIDGLKIYRSNLISSVTDGADTVFNMMVGHTSALTFATQLVKNETLKNPHDFGDLHRGLQVFGYKVVKPESLVHVYAKKG